MGINKEQKKICKKYGTIVFESPMELKIGISHNVRDRNLFPINGLRHKPEGDTTGWYIWGGEEFLENPDFFLPLHVAHIEEWRPEIMKYLALPPGYRFLIGENDYEDVWLDEDLLKI